MSHRSYFENVFSNASGSIGISKQVLPSKFERVNSFLLSQSLKQQNNLFIDSVNIFDDRELFRSTIYTLIHCYFNRNFVNLDSEKPEVGNKYQRGKKRYEVTDTGVIKAGFEGVMLQCINKGSDSRIDWVSLDYFYEDYIKLDDDAGRSNRNTFGPISDLIKLLHDKTGNISSYPNKFAIICSKKHFQDSFLLQERKAFPYEYITKNEVSQPNLPLPDFMFYIASSYDAIVDHVIDKNIELDLLVNIQNTNLREFENRIYTDRIKQIMHIGLERPKNRKSLIWRWTFPEINYLTQDDGFDKGLHKIVINNPSLNSAVEALLKSVKDLEDKYLIDLKQINRLVVDLFDVILLNGGKRTLNTVRNLENTFSDMLASLLANKLSHHGYDNEIFVNLVDCHKSLLTQVSSQENSKSEEFKELEEPQYILVPYNQNKQIWKNKIGQLHWRNARIIDYKEFKSLKDISQVLVLGIHNKYLFYSIYGSKHSIIWLLYKNENELFNKYEEEFNKSLEKEFSSSSRYRISGVKYIPEETRIDTVDTEARDHENESIAELLDRLFDDRGSYDDHYNYENTHEHQLKRIRFTDNTYADVSLNGLVIVIENEKPVLCSISELIEGEMVRVYENHARSALFDKLIESDDTGRFKEILESSHTWKNALRIKIGRFHSNAIAIARDFGVDPKTLNGWLKPDSKTKFPQNIKKLKPYLPDYEYELVCRHNRSFKRIMIAAGRDLSDEVSQYILNGSIGKLLSEFDSNLIQKLVDTNAPIRRIKEISRLF